MEVWRRSITLPEYLVSSEGRLMRLPYSSPMPHGGERHYGGEPHSGQWDGKRFIHQFQGKTYKVHRLVCEAFHGLAPFAGAVVMHKDEDSSNNSYTNLAWGTQKENLNAPGFLEYCRSRTGDDSPVRKGLRAREVA